MESAMTAKPLFVSLVAAGALAAAIGGPAYAQTYYDPYAAPAAPYAPVVPGYVAPSNMTLAFIANAMPDVNFLDSASRMAVDKASRPAIRRFAYNLAAQQTIAGNAMTAWAETDGPLMTGRSAYDPILGLATLPINVILGVGNALTGGSIVAARDGRALSRSQADDLARLSTAQGRDFDALYVQTQRDALLQLETIYSDYAVRGPDPGLRSLAQTELPEVRRRLADLNRI